VARIEDLVASVPDAQLRAAIDDEVKALKTWTSFGLVYEQHLPETLCLGVNGGLRVNDNVRLRAERDEDATSSRVIDVKDSTATIVSNGSDPVSIATSDLVAVRSFGDPIFPTLTSVGAVDRDKTKPYHCVINGENFHALQLLAHTVEGQVDCIYIDPPYNTGARDWKYDNHYVDETDVWRHSKWLSFMEKRLRVARLLLKPDSVLIVTIDEHEVHHLGLLLEQLFPEASRQMVSIVNNPKGVTQDRLSRVEEYAMFCFFGDIDLTSIGDDLLSPQTDEPDTGGVPRWKGLLRSGDEAARADRKDMFYPVLIDPDRGAVLGAGEPLPFEKAPNFKKKIGGLTPVWPVRRDGSLGRWSVGRTTLRQLIDKGYVALGAHQSARNTWAVSYLSKQLQEQVDAGVLVSQGFDDQRNVIDVRYTDPRARRIKTVWHRSSHDAGAYGTDLLKTFLGEKRFNYPKSLYAVRDTLAAVVGTKPDAVVLDFFGGSGTTLHATCLLNEQDGGNRRCILVTNNEVDEKQAKKLRKQGHLEGDPAFELYGIFEAVARPRVEAALTGKLDSGSPVPGRYLDGRSYADGFAQNCEFFRLDYVNPDAVELGRKFDALHALLWLKAGARSKRPAKLAGKRSFAIVPAGGYAVLFNEAAMPNLTQVLNETDGITHAFLCTHSDDAYAEMCELVRPGIITERLYADYLDEFRKGARLGQ
jgi:adenine-specific DNA-methyltransferase